MADETRTLTQAALSDAAAPAPPDGLGLAIAWSWADLDRLGELALLPGGREVVLGRGAHRPDAPAPRLGFYRARPGEMTPRPPLSARRLSRDQLLLRADARGIHLRSVGRCPVRVNGRRVTQAEVSPGDVVALQGCLLFLCVRHPGWMGEALPEPHWFGAADPWGIVGESPPAWEMRRQLRFIAARRGHVLISGASGAGKELAARALHRLSDGEAPFIARSAATIPEGLVEAELFGNRENYPNPGMAARPGLIGAADGGILFLDEFTTLSASLQARLLRVLDDGEYHRLGESAQRTARFRLVATTNQPDSALRHDVLPRFVFRLHAPDLNERRMDIPLLIRHMLAAIAADDDELRDRFFEQGAPRIDERLLTWLIRRRYTTHARELRALLWRALQSSPGDALTVPRDAAPAQPAPEAPRVWTAHIGEDPGQIPPEALQACLDEHNGNQEQTRRALGMQSRHVLYRLIKRHGLVVRKQN